MRFFFRVSRTILSVVVLPYSQKHFTRLSSTVMASRKPFIALAINKQESITSTKLIHVYINADATLTSFYRCSFAKAKKKWTWETHRKTRQTRLCVLHPTPWFITVFTTVRQLSLFSSRSIEYISSHFLEYPYSIVLPSMPRSSKDVFLSVQGWQRVTPVSSSPQVHLRG
jgi:hypothetical protein